MMHFSIPDSEELMDAYGTSYISYKIFCNGTFQGSARYRELYDLHESLRTQIPHQHLPTFPPKKLFHLSVLEVNHRKQQLEKYLQNLGQMSEALDSSAFQEFLKKILLRGLSESSHVDESDLKVYMLNESAVQIRRESTVTCEELLEVVAKELKLPTELTYFFGLFLAKEDCGRFVVFRKFAAFELPFAVLQLNQSRSCPLYIVIKKAYWDSCFDTEILDSPSKVGTNLLFVETVDAFNRGWLIPSSEQKAQMESLQNKGSRREFVLLARTIKGYGSLHFRPCYVDYPSPRTLTEPFLNAKELVCPLNSGKEEAAFKVTRMRCWRLCFSDAYKHADSAASPQSNLSIVFEYLIGRDQLQWISVASEEAIWMSSCLQSVVEELLLKKRGLKYQKSESAKRTSGKNSKVEETLSVSVSVTRRLTSDNSAFEEIGDDDL